MRMTPGQSGLSIDLAIRVLLLAVPARCEEQDDPEGVAIPEPMVFDLVLALGPERGDGEVNALFEYPLESGNDVLEWAPEVEYAVTRRFAVRPAPASTSSRTTTLPWWLSA